MILTFPTTISSKDGLVIVRPEDGRDRFPAFTEVSVEGKMVKGWVWPDNTSPDLRSAPFDGGMKIRGVQCFDFGMMPCHVAFVRATEKEIVFRRLPEPHPNTISTVADSEVRAIARAFATVEHEAASAWEVKFMSSMNVMARTSGLFTEKQGQTIYALLYKYRYQLQELYDKYGKNPHCKPSLPERGGSKKRDWLR
jgi:hypothetical protein